MRLHANARLSVKGRELLVERIEVAGWALTRPPRRPGQRAHRAQVAGPSSRRGPAGLLTVPRRRRGGQSHRRTAGGGDRRAARLRLTGAEIAELLGMALSTVSGVLTRIGMGKLGRLGLEPAQRYERQRPGELIHIDVKKLGRIQDGAGHRVTGRRGRYYTGQRTDAEGRVATSSAGNSCTSRSMTPPAWPMSKFSETRRRRPLSDSCAG